MDRFIDAASGMAVEAWGDPGRAPDLVFVHANGFNGLTYRSLLEPLGETLRVLAPDMRGHGRTTLDADPVGHGSWKDFRDDLTAMLAALPAPVVLAGHSMGATAGLMAAPPASDRVRSLVLLDPVILPRSAVRVMNLPWLGRLSARHPWALAALKRRSRFADRDAALRAYLGRGAFKGWPEEMLRDYVEAGFRDTADGEVELACSPAWEASNYAAQAHDPWAALKRPTCAIRVLKAGEGSPCSLEGPRPGVAVEVVPGATHFFPMIERDLTRRALLEASA